MTTEWEYDDFVREFKRGKLWYRLGVGGYTHADAKLQFWQDCQSYILPLLQRKLDEGWQPISEVGASGISLRQYTAIKWSIGMWIAVLLLTCITMGLGLTILLFGLAQYVEPVEFRVKLRRQRQ